MKKTKKALSIAGGVLSAAVAAYVVVCFINALQLAKEIYPNDEEDI